MRTITIIHYLPISYYPPAMNLVDIIENAAEVEVVSTKPNNGMLRYMPNKAKLFTPIMCKGKGPSILRLFKYIWFSFFCIIKLIQVRPKTVMYYESVSAFPVFIYKRFVNKKADIYVHYHEYSSEDEYNLPGRRLFAMNHWIERRWLYHHCERISQTNKKRLEMFLRDNFMIDKSKACVFPNYPPKSWWCKNKKHNGDVCKCVYVGSLSLQDTFVRQFCEWVSRQNGRVTFDIYCFNFPKDTLDSVTAMDCPNITFHKEGVSYLDIPLLFDRFDVGLILYKANTINFQWNETNKFYEYLICGLDIWYPKEMLLLHNMDKSQFAPNVKELDFDSIDSFIYDNTPRIVDNHKYNFFAENIYKSYFNE